MSEILHVYIAGPMRGVADHNHPAFDAAAEALRDAGYYAVFSPAEYDRQHGYNPATERTPDEIRRLLAVDLRWICRYAQVVVVLPGWETSRGAQAEVATARALDIPVMTLDVAVDHARRTGGERDA